MNFQDPGFFADAFQNRLKLHLFGDYLDGGRAVFVLENFEPDIIYLPPTEWAVLAVLADKLLNAVNWRDVYLSANELAKQLAKLEVVGLADASNTQNIVYRLRQRLNRIKTCLRLSGGEVEGGRDSFAKLIVAHHQDGYFLGLAPQNVTLTIEEPPPTESSREM